jgi:hypothetical protein
MRLRLLAFAGLLVAAAPAAAGDLANVDRRIAKEPAYEHKPLYCLAVIGPDATTRVWLVLDGDKLYVDKNCNGDPTDDGPPTELKETKTDPASFPLVDVSPDGGKTVYKFDVTLWNRPAFRGKDADPTAEPFNQSVHVTFPDTRYFGAWGDQHKPLTFAATRDAAPVLHFDGPLRMGFEIRQPLKRAKDGFELNACVGTPGSCDGAWVHMLYRTIPADKFPHVKMELPAEKPGGPPVRLDFALKQRC